MPEYRRYRRRSRPSTRALTAKFTALAVAATLAIGALIAIQMAEGNDPALGSKAAQAKKASTSSAATDKSTSGSSGSSDDDYYLPGPTSSGYAVQQSSPAPVTSSTS